MGQYRVTAAFLNVRQKPDIGSRIVGVLNKDEIVAAVDDPQNGYWRHVRRTDGLEGFASQKYLLSIADMSPQDHFPWMPIARGELGRAEVAGAGANPRIVEYLQSTTLPDQDASSNETPWCSGFVNWCVEKAGIAGTDSAAARSWLNWGKKLATPTEGCVAVFKREGNMGHVAFFVGESATKVRVLGGNQGNAVTIADKNKSDLLGYRTHS